MNKLGDHPGVPMLFGIAIDSVPYRIIMQFHGEKHGSVSIASALHEKKISQLSEWLGILKGVAKALSHVHEVGFLHNDLKCNNVVLDRQQANKSHYIPVIIDFGKSVPISGARGPRIMSEEKQKQYKTDYPHIAPEIVEGRSGQSFQSDIYSFGKMAEAIFLKSNLGQLPELLSRALSPNPSTRPTLLDLLKF